MLKHKRLVSIIAAIAFCLSFLAPALIAPAPAVAAGTISALRVPIVPSDSPSEALGTVKVTVPAGAIVSGDVVIFELPDDCEFSSDFGGNHNYLFVPEKISGDTNGLFGKLGVVAGSGAAGTSEVKIRAIADQDIDWDGVFYLYLGDIVIDGADGDLTASFDGPASGFPLGNVVIGRTSDKSQVQLSTSGLDTSNNLFDFTLRIKEDIAGALKDKEDSLVLTLPDGFEWNTPSVATDVETLWGDAFPGTFDVNDEELAIDLTAGSDTSVASAWDIKLSFEVVDEKAADEGDVIVKVKGKSNATPSELKVGTYGDFGVKVTCDEPTTVFAGKVKQQIGDFTLEEIIPESLIDGRYITLELPSYAKWTKIDDTPGDGGAATLTFSGVAGSNGNVLKYTIDDAGANAAEIDFEDFEVALDVVAPEDLVVKIGGNAGIEAEVVVAKIALPVVMKAENATEVNIGAANQKIGDLIITETVAGAIKDDTGYFITLKVPAGCEWVKVPTITVESGDLRLDLSQARRAKGVGTSVTSDYYQFIIIPVERDSNEPSVIKVTDCYVTVDRTVPEGALTVALLGPAVLESNIAYAGQWPLGPDGYQVGSGGMFPQTLAIAGAAAAKVVTPSEGGGVVSFYIGSQVYTVNGVQKFMDVAPYVKADRTYVPVRFLSEALGATVAWDEATKTVTVTKGDKSVVLVIGSTIAKINGADVQMDVAPEIVNGRTMLPARWVAEGLGYQVGWIPTLKQVVIQ